MRMRASAMAAFSVAVTTLPLIAGCGQQRSCMPEPLTVRPDTAQVGTSVVVSSPSTTCDLGYPAAGVIYRLELLSDARAPDQPEATEAKAHVASDGSFSTSLAIPTGFPTGPATVLVSGSALDQCQEEGASCAAYQVRLNVTD